VIWWRMLYESFRFALQALLEHKLRTFLSVLGITIGIFSIISVFTLVDSIRNNIDKSISSLGDQVIYIQKWPWEFTSDFPWWTYMNRPVTRYSELAVVRDRSQLAEASAFLIQANATMKFRSITAEDVRISAVSDGYERIKTFELAEGRYFTEAELKSGKNLVVIGSEVASMLFGDLNPVGRTLLIRNAQAEVIGVFKREGQNIIDLGLDNTAIVPINYARGLTEINTDNVNPRIMVKARAGISNQMLKDELTGIMRSLRRLPPRERDNFALNETKLISRGFDQLKDILYVTGGIIGFFSVLVGGFGIANIMFVSVKERTNIIGIQKSLGARRSFVLFEFLYESVLLSIIGGAIGLLLIFLLSLLLNVLVDFEVVLSFQNILLGLLISSGIGLISGLAPAFTASRLDPVEAIRSK
jgi:putative ABC transport system permease protein